jgi:hypothetical protein
MPRSLNDKGVPTKRGGKWAGRTVPFDFLAETPAAIANALREIIKE